MGKALERRSEVGALAVVPEDSSSIQPSVLPVPGDLTPFTGLHRYEYGAQTYAGQLLIR